MSEESCDEFAVEVVQRCEVNEHDWDQFFHKDSLNPILFKKFAGPAMSFHCKIDNLLLKRRYEKLIISYGGDSIEDYIDMNNTTALLVQENSKVMLYERPAFKVSYIIDCVKRNALLNISEYLHNRHSFKLGNYMNIIFWDKETFKTKPFKPYIDSSDSSDAEQRLKQSKHTKQLYSRKEKEAILKFLLCKKKLTGVRGNAIWKQMERRGICPKRTYQSMKNHFLKTMLQQLDQYEFLSDLDIKLLRKL